MTLPVEFDPVPDGWTALEGVAVVKCLDENGVLRLAVQASDGLTTWEAAGMLLTALDGQREELRRSLEDEDDL